MIQDNTILETIDNYLDGLMSEEERIAFEQQITNDSKLAQIVEETQLTNEAIYMASLSELKQQVGSDIKQIKYNAGPNYKGYIIAGALALIGAGTIGYIYNQSSKADESTLAKIESNTLAQQSSTIEQSEEKTIVDVKETSSSTIPTNKPLKSISSPSITVNNPVLPLENKNEKKEGITTDLTENKVTSEHTNTKNELKTSEVSISKNELNSNSAELAPQTIDCSQSYSVQSDASCKNEATGSITVKINTNPQPSNIVLDGTIAKKSGLFMDLKAGKHEIKVTYAKDCSFIEAVVVEEKWCPLNKNYSFNPDYNEQWELNYEEGSEGNLIIFNKLGREVYTNTFGSGSVFWNGSDSQGVPVPIGTYIAIIRYADGRKEKIELTIVK